MTPAPISSGPSGSSSTATTAQFRLIQHKSANGGDIKTADVLSTWIDTFRTSDGQIPALNTCALSDLCKMAIGTRAEPSFSYTARVLIGKGLIYGQPKDSTGWISPIDERKLAFPQYIFISPSNYIWSLTQRASKDFTKAEVEKHLASSSSELSVVVDSLYLTFVDLFNKGPDGILALYDLYLLSSGNDKCFPQSYNSKKLLCDTGLIYQIPQEPKYDSIGRLISPPILFVHETVRDLALASIKVADNQLSLSYPDFGQTQTMSVN